MCKLRVCETRCPRVRAGEDISCEASLMPTRMLQIEHVCALAKDRARVCPSRGLARVCHDPEIAHGVMAIPLFLRVPMVSWLSRMLQCEHVCAPARDGVVGAVRVYGPPRRSSAACQSSPCGRAAHSYAII